MHPTHYWSRRSILLSATYAPALALTTRSAVAALLDSAARASRGVAPFGLEDVRLTSSPFLTAVESNRAYLLRLEPDRLLHNFRAQAGLRPKGAAYGGWEATSLAGHSLGHYLSACSLMYAQVGAVECRQRVEYIVNELAACQARQGDGYVAAFTRGRGNTVEAGKAIFPEIRAGDIRSASFELNGAWSPLYTLHKQFAGLLDAHRYCGNGRALNVAAGLGGYLDKVLSRLSDDQLQQVLNTEHGGLNESFAELYVRTGQGRWRALAERLYHRKVLEPLAAQRDELPDLHSNTQIPKLIGLARLYELTGEERHATAAGFFWHTVTRNHSYVIGGNADRESFKAPLSKYVTEQTCEACNTYNMLKLTRHLYQWNPDAAYFDYYERAHLNHILAHHDPDTGMFTYMMPLMAGARREFSKPFDDFWCCMGTGMESHSKHGDSIYWHRADQLFVNLYIPSELSWRSQEARFALRTEYPLADSVTFSVTSLAAAKALSVAFRIPGWCEGAQLQVNGKTFTPQYANGYAVVRRTWSVGDTVTLRLPMRVRMEATPDDPSVVALLYGPLVLAADLGAADGPEVETNYAGSNSVGSGPATATAAAAGTGAASVGGARSQASDADAAGKDAGAAGKPTGDGEFVPEFPPALVGADALAAIRPATGAAASFTSGAATRPGNLTLKPFFSQYTRRSAVYFRNLTDDQWQAAHATYLVEQGRLRALRTHAIDVVFPGKSASELSHAFREEKSESVQYRGRNGRQARKGTWFEFRMKVIDGPMVLQNTYWGDEANSHFRILVDGVAIGTQRLPSHSPAFFDHDYPIPEDLTRGRSSVTVRFEPEPDASAGPVYECRMLRRPGGGSAGGAVSA